MKVKTQRLIAVLLAVVMIVGMLPVSAFASTDAPFTASVGTVSKYADGYYIVEVPGGTTSLNVTLDEDFDLSNDGGNKWYSWGDFDEITYDSSTYTYGIVLSEIAYNGYADLADFGCAAGEATYYYFETINNDTWDTEYRVLIKEAAVVAPFSTDTGTISQYSDTKYVVNVPANTTILQVTTDQMYVILAANGNVFDLFWDWVNFDNMSYNESTSTYTMDLSELTLKANTAETVITGFGCSPADGIYYCFDVLDEDWNTQYSVLVKAPGVTVVPAAKPSISRHPVSATYDQGDDPVALTVTASVTAGTLSYAWYAEGSDEVLSTEATFTPPTDEVGITEYYVVITNSEAGKEDTSVTSGTATIEVREALGAEPEQNDDGYYILDSKADLFWFAGMVNRDEFDGEMNAELGCDIDLEDDPWTPIGAGNYYWGHFNGNGFSITGINIIANEDYDDPYVGFFAYVEESTIENLKLYGSITVTEDAGAYYIGGLAGDASATNLKKCISYIDIVVECDAENVGGLLGCIGWAEETVEISYCASVGDITTVYATSIGGLIGYTCCDDTLILSYCYYKGNLESEADFVGGIIGLPENDLIMTQVYTFATVCDDLPELPDGVDATTIIGGYYFGDIFGLCEVDCEFNGVYCISDYMDGDCQLGTGELDGTDRIYYYETVEDFLDALNSGDDEAAYALSDDNSLILAWELQTGVNPDQKDQLLQEGKEQTLTDIETLFETTYLESNYEEADWNKVTGYRDAAEAAVESATQIEQLATIISQMKTDIDAVPTAAERLAAYIEPLITAVEKAYYHEVIQSYSVQKSGYLYDLEQYLDQTDKLGIMHDLKDTFLSELENYKTLLLNAKDNGLVAIRNATTKAEADSAKASAISAMAKVVEDAEAHTVDNGVADKWDGATKTQPSGQGTKASPYQIGNGAELAWFAEQVNSGNKNLWAVLTKDIDLNGKSWTPIAMQAKDEDAYAGTFDGQGHGIHGLAVVTEKIGDRCYGGLFGNLGKNGVIKNVRVAGIVKQMLGSEDLSASTKLNYAVGGIAGCSAGVIYNCESSVVLTNGKTYSYCNYMGGIVGYQYGGVIEACESYAILYKDGTANFQTGFGGVTGYSTNASLIRYTNSHAFIDLGPSVLGNVGGITGTLSGTSQIRECRNTGTINHGCGIVGSVLEQASVAYAWNEGTTNGENGMGSSTVRRGAAIAGYVKTSGTLSHLYNTGECVYGLINDLQMGTVNHGRSDTVCGLWGTVDLQHSSLHDCIKVDETNGFESSKSTGALGEAKLNAAITLLGKMKSSSDPTYGTQSDAYNAVVMQFLRRTEVAKDVESIDLLLTQAQSDLNAVPTQLMAEKEALINSLNEFVTSHVYDATEQAKINALLEEAITEANSAATIKNLNKVKEKYLGTDEQPGEFETQCDTYNDKSKNELYDEFLYNKTYSTDDTATLLSIYMHWGVKLDRAHSIDEMDVLFADARMALYSASENITETGSAPDMDEANTIAINLAKSAAMTEIENHIAEIKAEINNSCDKVLNRRGTSGFATALEKIKSNAFASIDQFATVDFSTLTDYAEIEDAKTKAIARTERYAKSAQKKIEELISSADSASANTWDGVTLTEPQIVDGVYQIGTGAELAWFANAVNNKTSGTVFSAILTADIDLGYHEWMPIGNTATGSFTGTFDGNGHTVKGLYISQRNTHSDYNYYGLFGIIRSNSKISDLCVKGTIEITGINTKECVGGIVGAVETSSVENSVSFVNITIKDASYASSDAPCVGGIVGKINSNYQNTISKVTDCSFRGAIETINTASGKLAKGVAGIAGRIEGPAQLQRNANYGDITVDKAYGVGGIVGVINVYQKNVSVTDCANWANISNDPDGIVESEGGTGGIVGVAAASQGDLLIANCYNTGTITASKVAGGVLGGENGNISAYADRTGSPNLVVKNCYNAGQMVGPNNQIANRIGSLVGNPLSGKYMDKLFVLKDAAQGVHGWISSQGDSISTVSAVDLINEFADGTNMVESIADLNGGYPVFAWQLLDKENRQHITDYLNTYFETEIKDYATKKQGEAITDILDAQADAIDNATSAQAVITAYQISMTAMDKAILLTEAKNDALAQIATLIETYKAKYEELSSELEALKAEKNNAIETAETPAGTDVIIDQLDAAVVELLIADIGTINDDITTDEAELQKGKISVAEEAYNALSDAKKLQVRNFIKLNEAKAAMQSYETAYATNKAAADKVTEDIHKIGTVTLESKSAIETALNGYNALNDKQKAMVPQEAVNTLETAQTKYNELVAAYNADVKAAKDVVALIDAIGTVSLDSKDAITAAINGYNALTESQKKMVSKEKYDAMEAASKKYQELVVAYNNDVAAATAVIEKINLIGTVTLNSKEAIAEATTLYNALTDTQKAMVSDAAYTTLQNAISTYNALEAKDAADKKAAKEVAETIKAIGTVTLNSKSTLSAAREAYNALTEEQKALVPAEVLQLLTTAEKDYETLVKAEEDKKQENNDTSSVTEKPEESKPSEETKPDSSKPSTQDKPEESDPSTDEQSDDSEQIPTQPDENTPEEDENPAGTKPSEKPFDWSIVWIVCGIVAAGAVAFGIVRWFMIANKRKRK